MHRIPILLFIAAAATLAACNAASGPQSTPDPSVPDASESAGLPDTLHVPVGAERTADGGRVAVRFLARLSDSRCPANAMCVWEGDASVRLRIRVGTQTSDTVLHTSLEPRSATFAGYVFSVPGLFPYPGTYPEGQPAPAPTVLVAITRA